MPFRFRRRRAPRRKTTSRRTTRYRRSGYRSRRGRRVPVVTRFVRMGPSNLMLAPSSTGYIAIGNPNTGALGYNGSTFPLVVNSLGTQMSRNIGDVVGGMSFRVQNDTVNSSFLTNWDRFQLTGVSVKITFLENTATVTTNAGIYPVMPTLWYRVDYDDATAPASLVNLKQTQPVKRFQFGPGRPTASIYFKPRVARLLYDSTGVIANVGFESSKAGWLDTLNLNMEHYGLKWGLENVMFDPTNPEDIYQHFRFDVKYYVKVANILA